jgi:hypothetical protein
MGMPALKVAVMDGSGECSDIDDAKLDDSVVRRSLIKERRHG